VHSPQLGQLTLEPLNPGMLLTAHSHPLVGIHLGVAHTAAQRLGCPHTQLGSYDLDAGPLPAIARAYLGDAQPQRIPFTDAARPRRLTPRTPALPRELIETL
jgi:hypothetical protein